MAATATGAKYCCKCGTDVSGSKRMKDSAGKYWCLPCGTKDQQKQAASAGMTCVICSDIFPTSQTTKLAGKVYCKNCLKERQKSEGGGLSDLFDVSRWLPSSGGSEDEGRTKKSIITLVILVVLIIGVNYLLHRS